MILDASKTPLVVRDGKSVFEFRTTGGASWPVWDRFIELRGGLTFHIGNVCNTCDFFFERMSEALPDTKPAAAIVDLLGSQLKSLSDIPLEAISAVLPDGQYHAIISVGIPHLAQPGDPDDFFTREQVELWAIEPSTVRESPHDPGTYCYRLGSYALGEGRALYEFVVPTVPLDRLDDQRVEYYRLKPDGGGTVLAVSVFDVKRPALFSDSPPLDVTEHWTLTHYLLDGNHKTREASLNKRAISILSFIAVEHGVSTDQELSDALRWLSAVTDTCPPDPR